MCNANHHLLQSSAGKPVTVSSQKHDDQIPSLVSDGDQSTFWCPKDDHGSWLVINLQQRRYVAYFFWQVKTKGQKDMNKALRIRVGDAPNDDGA